GTNLLEIGAIDEATLLRYLSQATHLPWADHALLTEIDWQAVELLDLETIKSLQVLPLRLDGDVVRAVVTDPLDDETRARLKAQLPNHIQQFITSEFRFFSLLEKLFDVPLQKRFRLLNDRFPIEDTPEAPHAEVDEAWELMTTNFGVRHKSTAKSRRPSGIRVGLSEDTSG